MHLKKNAFKVFENEFVQRMPIFDTNLSSLKLTDAARKDESTDIQSFLRKLVVFLQFLKLQLN